MEKNSWDQSLLKKFGTTSHFRLLSQLKSEIKAYPLIRNTNSNNLTNQQNSKSTKEIDAKPSTHKYSLDKKNHSVSETLYSNVNDTRSISNNFSNRKNANYLKEEHNGTFSERLQDIDMR